MSQSLIVEEISTKDHDLGSIQEHKFELQSPAKLAQNEVEMDEYRTTSPVSPFSRTTIKISRPFSIHDKVESDLMSPVEVTVHDYGTVDSISTYHINGDDFRNVDENFEPKTFQHIEKLISFFNTKLVQNRKQGIKFEDKDIQNFFDFRPMQTRVRWIDIEGMNAEIMTYFLHLTKCHRQFIFDNLIDLKQRVMGLLLDPIDEDPALTSFLMVTKVPSMHPDAENKRKAFFSYLEKIESDPSLPRDPPPFGPLLDYEQITYLMIVNMNDHTGTLITFQEGKEGDVYGEVREMLREGDPDLLAHGPAHLFMHLIRASTESAMCIEKFLSETLHMVKEIQDRDLRRYEENQELFVEELGDFSRFLQREIEVMGRVMEPFEKTLRKISENKYPPEITGRSRGGWSNIVMQHARLRERTKAVQARAEAVQGRYDSSLSRRHEQLTKESQVSSFYLGLILAMFTPLSFLTAVYGMNFIDEEGNHAIPELNWTVNNNYGISGYGYFWILNVSLVVFTLALYVYSGLLVLPSPLQVLFYFLSPITKLFQITKERLSRPQIHSQTSEDLDKGYSK